MKKYIFLGIGIILCAYIQAMEQLHLIPGNDTAPDYMKYVAICGRCKKQFTHISKSAISNLHKITGKCPYKLQYTKEPLFKFNLLIECPTVGCNYTKKHIATYDSMNTIISKLTNHIWEMHNQSVKSNIELRNTAISKWHYIANDTPKKRNIAQIDLEDDETNALLVHNLKYPRKEHMSN